MYMYISQGKDSKHAAFFKPVKIYFIYIYFFSCIYLEGFAKELGLEKIISTFSHFYRKVI